MMNILLLILIFTNLSRIARSTRDDFGTNFILNFIANENKPTSLILYNLCLGSEKKMYLAHVLVKSGIRISSSYIQKSKYYNHDVMFLLDLDCSDAEHTLKMAMSQRLISGQFRWLMIANSSESLQSEVFSGLPILPNSDIVLAVRTGNYFKIDELHRPFLDHPIIVTPRGFFNGTLTDVRQRRELYRRRIDLMGHPLTMSNVIQDSNTTQYHLPLEDGLDYQNDAVAKISWMCAKLGMLMVNATPRYTFAYRWGYKLGDRWSGMIEELNAGRADMALLKLIVMIA